MTRSDRPDDDRAATFRDALAVPPFRRLWLGQLLSILGDQIARVALSVLVYDRTSSAALTAATYALTFLPDLVAGPLLSGLADRFPRRRVMVLTDVGRAVLVAAMAVPGMPLPVLVVLLVAGQLLAAPFLAARSAILPALLEGDRYVAGNAVINTTYQFAQVLGFALGGPLVAVLGVGPALALDAATFVVSAAVLHWGVPEQPVPDDVEASAGLRGELARVVGGARVVGSDSRLRSLIALACISAFVVTVEGLAAPYAAELGAGTAAVGVLLAANPLGQVLGILLFTRLVPPSRRPRLIGPLAVASCVPLVASAFGPPLWVLVGAWVLSGMACAYQVAANAAFVTAVDDARRGQAFGLAVTALRVTQGLGVLGAGLVAQRTAPSTAVALGGGVGVVVALLAAWAWARASGPGSSPVPEPDPPDTSPGASA